MKGVAPVHIFPSSSKHQTAIVLLQTQSPHTVLVDTTQELCNVWFWHQVERTSREYAPDWPALQCDHWHLIRLLHRQSFNHILHLVLLNKIKYSLHRLVPGSPTAVTWALPNGLKVSYKEMSLLHIHPFLTFTYSMDRLEFTWPDFSHVNQINFFSSFAFLQLPMQLRHRRFGFPLW